MSNALLIDGRNMLDPVAMRAAGFTYEGIGRAAAEREPVGRHSRRRRSAPGCGR